jgi:hypothetical protein
MNTNIGGQYNMFMEVLNQDNYKTIDEFTDKLDKKYSYHFVLIHHKNDNIVNYKNQFGDEYKKLCFIFARNNDNQKDVNPEETNATFISDNIFYPKKIDEKDTQQFITNLSNINIINQPEHEGIIIKSRIFTRISRRGDGGSQANSHPYRRRRNCETQGYPKHTYHHHRST